MSKGRIIWAFKIDEGIRTLVSDLLLAVVETVIDGGSEKYKPEITLLTDVVFYQLAHTESEFKTPGMKLFNLSSSKTSKLRSRNMIAYFLYCWCMQKAKYKALIEGWRTSSSPAHKRAHALIEALDTITKIAHLINFLKFLWSGQYPSLIYRVLGCEMESVDATISDKSGGLNGVQIGVRQRHILIGLIMAVATAGAGAVDWPQLRDGAVALTRSGLQRMSRIEWIRKSLPPQIFPSTSSESKHPTGSDKSSTNKAESLVITCCSCAQLHPEMPHITNCGHVFCYLCIAILTLESKVTDNSNSLCPACSEPISEYNRWVAPS